MWQNMEKTMCLRGNESERYNRTWRIITAYKMFNDCLLNVET